MVTTSSFLSRHFTRHLFYFLGFHLINALIHLLLLSFAAFFHFLLDHRMADIQDWVFFHGWEILGLGKITSFFIVSRFINVLSIERRPLIHLFHMKRGIFRKEVLVALVIFILGLILVGRPQLQEGHELNLYRVLVSSFGILIFYGTEMVLILSLNEYLPLKRRLWHSEIVLFSLLSFIIHKMVFLYGTKWDSHVIFFFILGYYLLRFRGEFVWLHSLLFLLLLMAPIAAFFGLDPIWGSRFSLMSFSDPTGGLEVGIFTLVCLIYFKVKRGYSFLR